MQTLEPEEPEAEENMTLTEQPIRAEVEEEADNFLLLLREEKAAPALLLYVIIEVRKGKRSVRNKWLQQMLGVFLLFRREHIVLPSHTTDWILYFKTVMDIWQRRK